MLTSLVSCVGKTIWLCLQTWPNPVFGGDALALGCQGRKHAALSQVKFHKDGELLCFSKDNQPLSMETTMVKSSDPRDGTQFLSQELILKGPLTQGLREISTIYAEFIKDPSPSTYYQQGQNESETGEVA
ncbi:PREDICTED: Fc receptor-like protein 6 [Galeopterus variegatus]|uniref:Fc receptor-like protein 6 n=1 Tax=Galeopterus variegatus TaxID=482537 RepID=A0ABM0QHC1_GALVR|nr:PREDICTED: Fc receptor-like protein 6 [Galeopterus variegatus]